MEATTQSLDHLKFTKFENTYLDEDKYVRQKRTTSTPYENDETLSQQQTQNTSIFNKLGSDQRFKQASIFDHTEVESDPNLLRKDHQKVQPNKDQKIISEKLIDDIIANREKLRLRYEHNDQQATQLFETNINEGPSINLQQDKKASLLYGQSTNLTTSKKRRRQDPGKYSFVHDTIIEEDPDDLYERQVSEYSQQVQRLQNKLSQSLQSKKDKLNTINQKTSQKELQSQINNLQLELQIMQAKVSQQENSQFVPYHYSNQHRKSFDRIVQDQHFPKKVTIGVRSDTLAATDQRKLLSIEYQDIESQTLIPFQENPYEFMITKKQDSNLEKLFKFYATQHSTQEVSKLSFDELKEVSNSLTQSDFMKLCDDFKMPISRDDLLEIFRVKALRSKTKIHNKLDLEGFKDTLQEIFYVKETQNEIHLRQKEIKILSESDLTWSMEQKQEVIEHIARLQNGCRDPSRDHVYLSKAHQHLHTHDFKYIQAQLRSVNLPFKSVVQNGQRVNQHSYISYDHKVKGRFVSEPKTGISIVQNYDHVTQKYFDSKMKREFESQISVQQLASQTKQTVQKNRQKYKQLKNQKLFQPQNLERDSLQQFQKAKQERDKIKLLRQQELHPEKFEKPKRGQNWENLSKLNYPAPEQREITKMIGLKYDPLPVKGKEGKGGGGQPNHRRHQTIDKVGTSQVFQDSRMLLHYGLNQDVKPVKKINYLKQSNSAKEKSFTSSKRDQNTIYMKSSTNIMSPQSIQHQSDYNNYQFKVPNIRARKSISIPPKSSEQFALESNGTQNPIQQYSSLKSSISNFGNMTQLSLLKNQDKEHQSKDMSQSHGGYSPSKFSVSGSYKFQDPNLAQKRKELVMMMKNNESIERVKRMKEQMEVRKLNKSYWESRNKSTTDLHSNSQNQYSQGNTQGSAFDIYGIESQESHSTKIYTEQIQSNQFSEINQFGQNRFSHDLISISRSNKSNSFYTNTFNQRS